MTERTKVALSQLEYDKFIDKIKVCGMNRGPHDYIPIEWKKLENNKELVNTLMCRVCFSHVKIELLLKEFDEITHPG